MAGDMTKNKQKMHDNVAEEPKIMMMKVKVKC